MPLRYSNYIKIPELLSLQKPLSQPLEHDEMLFIIIHQTIELWFKAILFELDKVKRVFLANEPFSAIQSFKRIRTIMKTLVEQMDILETMTPLSFASFRERLETASGFQSSQFRELEFVLGYKREAVLKGFEDEPENMAVLRDRLQEPSVIDYFYRFLQINNVRVPQELLSRDVTQPVLPNLGLQDALLVVYKTKPELAILFELMVDFDEGLQEWRYRHVKLTERTVGNKTGTGGSTGVEFLKKTLFKPIFADLWEVRKRF